MSGHSTPGTSRLLDPLPPARNRVLDTVTPVVGMIKEVIGGMPVPGLETVVGGAAIILETLQTMRNNRKGLRKLRKELEKLNADINDAIIGKSTIEQVFRLVKTSDELKGIITTCNELGESRKIDQFLKSQSIATQIADVRQSVRDTLQAFQAYSIISIEDKVGLINKNAEYANRTAILDKLERAPARFDARETPSECMGGTRVELLDKLVGSMKSTARTSQFTLVCGIPGSGKSTIAKTIAVRLKDQGLLAASFFFSRNHAIRREISLLFSTIAFQLSHYNDEYGDILSKILKEDADLAHTTPLDQLEKLIIYPLSQLTPKPKEPWVILLDALDECGSDRGEILLELLLSRASRFPDYVRFFFTGRPEDPILSAFEAPSIIPLMFMHTLDATLEAPVSYDIRHYLRQSLGGESRGWHGWKVKDDDLDALATRAGGLFIFASTAVKYIRDRAARHDPQTSVDFILYNTDESKKPRLLDQLYFGIVDDAAPADDEEFVALYRRVLGAIVNLLEPLGMAAIADLLGMAFGDVSRIISLLSSVLLVSGETIRIAHLSFMEYVTGTIRKDREDLLLDGPTHHSDIANGSINLMNEKLHRNMCDLKPPDMYARNVSIPNLKAVITEKIPPSLRYACMYWASHFPGADNVDPKGLEEWLDTKVLFWLEVLSVCNVSPRAASLIFDARAQYDRMALGGWTDSAHYRTLLSDTSQFIAAFYDIIWQAANYIFYSALPFTPSSSELSRTYNRFVRVIKGADSAWSPLLCTVRTWKPVYGVAFSPNGNCIAAACRGNIQIRSAESGDHLLTIKGHTDAVRVAAFSPNGAHIASGSDDKTIRIWSLDNGQHLFTLEGHIEEVNAVVFSPDGAHIASGSSDKTIRIWSARNGGQLLSILEGHTESVFAVAFSPNGARLISGSFDETVRIWSSDNYQLLSTLDGHTKAVFGVAFSPDGTRIISGSFDETIRIWSLDNGELLTTLQGHTGGVYTIAFSPDGTRIASGSFDKTIRIWSSDNGRLLSTLEGHDRAVFAVAFSPDSSRVISGSWDGSIRIWSSDGAQPLPVPKAHIDQVSVVFSPDGAFVVSGASDSIRVWSSKTGEPISTHDRRTHSVEDVVHSSKQKDTFLLSDTSPAMHGLSELETSEQQLSPGIQVDIHGGQLTLPSGELLCIIPGIHLPIHTSAQFGSLLALGLYYGGLVILDFAHHPHFQ